MLSSLMTFRVFAARKTTCPPKSPCVRSRPSTLAKHPTLLRAACSSEQSEEVLAVKEPALVHPRSTEYAGSATPTGDPVSCDAAACAVVDEDVPTGRPPRLPSEVVIAAEDAAELQDEILVSRPFSRNELKQMREEDLRAVENFELEVKGVSRDGAGRGRSWD
jgi:hypothetical protein